MVPHWSLSDNKSPQVSRTLHSILADLKNAAIWIISSRSVISKSSGPCTNSLVTGPSAPITIGITVTFMFNSFSIPWQGLVIYHSFPFLSVLLSGQPGKQNPQFGKFFFFSFFLTITRSGRLTEIRSSVSISKSQRNLFVSFSRTDSGLCLYPLFVWSHFNFLQTFPI